MLEAVLGVSIVVVVIWATVAMMRNRSATRKVGMEAAQLNVMSNDSRRAFWSAIADDGFDGGDSGGDAGGSGGSD